MFWVGLRAFLHFKTSLLSWPSVWCDCPPGENLGDLPRRGVASFHQNELGTVASYHVVPVLVNHPQTDFRPLDCLQVVNA